MDLGPHTIASEAARKAYKKLDVVLDDVERRFGPVFKLAVRTAADNHATRLRLMYVIAQVAPLPAPVIEMIAGPTNLAVEIGAAAILYLGHLYDEAFDRPDVQKFLADLQPAVDAIVRCVAECAQGIHEARELRTKLAEAGVAPSTATPQ